MKKIWCDLCGKQITDFTYIKVEANQVGCEDDSTVYYTDFPLNGKPLEVHSECLMEAFADFNNKKKLPEGQ